MNQQEQIKEKPPLDPVTGQPTPREAEAPAPKPGRSGWPLLIILLAGLVLALIAWLPAELTRDAENAPVAPGQTDQATPPAPTAPAPTAPAQPQSQPAQ